MNQSKPCCRDPQSWMHITSPFSRIIAFVYYDGPTHGIVECRGCQEAYKFEMLDWDDEHGTRIFRFFPLAAGTFEKVVSVLAASTTPRWPIWVPALGPADCATTEAKIQAVESLLESAGPAHLLVGWKDDGARVLAARSIPERDLNESPDWFSLDDPDAERPWFSLLGLTKRPTPSVSGR